MYRGVVLLKDTYSNVTLRTWDMVVQYENESWKTFIFLAWGSPGSFLVRLKLNFNLREIVNFQRDKSLFRIPKNTVFYVPM